MRLPLKINWNFHLVQCTLGTMAWVVMGLVWYAYVNIPASWDSLVARFKALVITYKALHDVGPGYLRDHLSPIASACQLIQYGELASSGLLQLNNAIYWVLGILCSSIFPLEWGFPQRARWLLFCHCLNWQWRPSSSPDLWWGWVKPLFKLCGLVFAPG